LAAACPHRFGCIAGRLFPHVAGARLIESHVSTGAIHHHGKRSGDQQLATDILGIFPTPGSRAEWELLNVTFMRVKI